MEFWSICEAVAKYCGYEVKPKEWLYLDPYGCDLVVECQNLGTSCHIFVSVGGILYYEHHSYENGCHPWEVYRNEKTAWKDLVDGIWSEHAETIDRVNYTLIEVCKREAEENRELTKRIVDRCAKFAKSSGHRVRGNKYVARTSYSDKILEICYEEKECLSDPDFCVIVAIKPSVDSKKEDWVFYYTHNEKPALGERNVHRYKPGPWELTLATLAR